MTGLPFSSRRLMTCFDRGAEQFGWAARDARPVSMRDGKWQVGYGCASAAYGPNTSLAAVRVALRPNGHAQVRVAAHNIGTGASPWSRVTAADRLGPPLGHIMVEMGGTELPPAALVAESSHTAMIARPATTSNEGPPAAQDASALVFADGKLGLPSEPVGNAVKRVSDGAVEVYAENVPAGSPEGAMSKLHGGQNPMLRGHKRKDATTYAFGAQFAEVRMHSRTREIRVPRMLGRLCRRADRHPPHGTQPVYG